MPDILSNIPLAIKQLVSTDQAWHYRIVPFAQAKNASICCYVDAEAWHEGLQKELELVLGNKVSLESLNHESFDKLIRKNYLVSNNRSVKRVNQDVGSEDFIYDLLEEAKALDASDIHFEVYEDNARLRLRIDGKLMEKLTIGKSQYLTLVNRVKILSNLDISEKRLPQDGRILLNRNNIKFDLRVSILPTMYGEKIVLRILGSDAQYLDIEKLGFQELDLQRYLEGAKKNNGIVLISGPTGSGKTTTLYSTLKLLNAKDSNIVTIEDPIEYTLEGINQVQLKESIGLDFSKALKTFLRQDPDIIMVGEIRDVETAQIAIRAALTGHLVLSTIHTNSAWGTISRLIDMGIPPYMVASTLNVSVAQRLVRKLCNHCKEKQEFTKSMLPLSIKSSWKSKLKEHYVAKGCDQCFYTGYAGRKALYEVIPIDEEVAQAVKNSAYDINDIMQEKQIDSLVSNAIKTFESGETSFEEIYSILINH